MTGMVHERSTSTYAFMDAFKPGESPDTVNPSLWRQAKLNNVHGLFEVVDDIYQVRGYDLSNISFVRGETGWIVLERFQGFPTRPQLSDRFFGRTTFDDHGRFMFFGGR